MTLSRHHYQVTVEWTGNRGSGTGDYRSYGRDHRISAPGVPVLLGSADPTFHGDKDRWNPEQLLLCALTQCHMLSYLHVAVQNGVVVTGYRDQADGELGLNPDGSGQFVSVTLRPQVSIADPSQAELAASLHETAGRLCFIARSVNFPVHHEPVIMP